jgi:hypothetical protein
MSVDIIYGRNEFLPASSAQYLQKGLLERSANWGGQFCTFRRVIVQWPTAFSTTIEMRLLLPLATDDGCRTSFSEFSRRSTENCSQVFSMYIILYLYYV